MNKIDSFLNESEREEVAKFISSLEEKTSGEIRVAVRFKRGFFEKNKSVHELAIKEFHRLKMHKTRDKTGVLLFFLLDHKEFHIVADEGIHTKVEDGTWDKIASELTEHFKQQKFKDGILHGLKKVGAILSQHFPRKSDDTNELSNEVSFR